MSDRDPEACALCPDVLAETKEVLLSLTVDGEQIEVKRFYLCLSCFMKLALFMRQKPKPS